MGQALSSCCMNREKIEPEGKTIFDRLEEEQKIRAQMQLEGKLHFW